MADISLSTTSLPILPTLPAVIPPTTQLNFIRNWWKRSDRTAAIAEARLLHRIYSGQPNSIPLLGQLMKVPLDDQHDPRRQRLVNTFYLRQLPTGAPFTLQENTEFAPIQEDGSKNLVVCHGYGAGLGFFYRNYFSMSQIPGLRLFAIDWLGMGRSSRPRWTIAPKNNESWDEIVHEAEDHFVQSLEDWRKSVGLDKMTLMGHSMGGYFAVCYALKYPKRVEKLILVSPAGIPEAPPEQQIPENNPPSEALNREAAQLNASLQQEAATAETAVRSNTPQRKIPEWARYLWDNNVTPMRIVRLSGPFGARLVNLYTSRRFAHLAKEEQHDLYDYLYHITSSTGSGEYALAAILAPGAFARKPLFHRLAQLEMPTVFIYGENDWMDYRAAEKASKFMTVPTKVIRVPGGHHMYLDKSTLFDAALAKELAFAMKLSEKVQQWLQLLPVKTKDSTSVETALLIVRTLRKSQCCYRCCLRFIGCRDMPLYRATENELDEAFRALDKDAIDVPAGPCTACVGALQHADAAAFLDPVCERLAQEKYESSYVNLTCTIPVCMMHRDHLLSMYICDQLPEEAKAQWKDHAVRDPKDPFKAIWGEKLIERTGLKIDASAPLRMTVVLEHSATASEHLFLTQTKTPVLKIRKVKKSGRTIRLGDSRSSIADALKSLDETEARSLTAVPPLPQTTVAEFSSVELVHESCLVGGRYLKYSREYSQTPWAIRGKKLAENSVSECIGEVLKQHARCDDYKFVPAGREDANVRMLGTGRPFYCELINPRRPVLPMAEYKEMENEVNALPSKDDVQVQQLVQVQSKHTKIIKEGEQFKRKTYRALVWVSEPLDDAMISRVNVAGSVPFHIKQGTPIRVFQRRAAAVREKEIHYCTIERVPEDQHLAILTLNTQAGTYIKEFVHGDLGRTVPNLASIAGVKAADLLDLDVLEVDLEWPPRMIDG